MCFWNTHLINSTVTFHLSFTHQKRTALHSYASKRSILVQYIWSSFQCNKRPAVTFAYPALWRSFGVCRSGPLTSFMGTSAFPFGAVLSSSLVFLVSCSSFSEFCPFLVFCSSLAQILTSFSLIFSSSFSCLILPL